VREAEREYLAWIAEDLERLLGAEIALERLTVARDAGRVTLVASYRLDDSMNESRGSGPTVVAAHASLRRAIVEDRIAFALRAVLAAVR
jgi:hypothetical protein